MRGSAFKPWTREHIRCESAGAYGALVTLIEKDPRCHSSRTLAAYARAAAFMGQREGSLRAISDLEGRALNAEAEAVTRLARSQLERGEGRWTKAFIQAKRAASLARSAGNPSLEADAGFAMAICDAELGRVFLALSQFERIWSDRALPVFRRGLAALNHAWLLWDLGQTQAIERVYQEVPSSYRPRLKLCLAMLHGDQEQLRDLFGKRMPEELPPSERSLMAVLGAEAAAVLGLDLRGSWAIDELQGSLGIEHPDPVRITCARQALNLLGKKNAPRRSPTKEWRGRLKTAFLELLLANQQGNRKEALRIYERIVNPILDEKHLQTPLIPSYRAGRIESDYPWALALSARLGLSRKGRPAVGTELQVEIAGRELRYRNGKDGGAVDLNRSPISIRLLKILSGRKGHRISKEFIHSQLTHCRYVRCRHDSRIHKLLKRLERRLLEKGIGPLWIMPGDNFVELNCRIEVVE